MVTPPLLLVDTRSYTTAAVESEILPELWPGYFGYVGGLTSQLELPLQLLLSSLISVCVEAFCVYRGSSLVGGLWPFADHRVHRPRQFAHADCALYLPPTSDTCKLGYPDNA